MKSRLLTTRVSVPSRGFNSHYGILPALMISRPTRFRPLSGIQFSLPKTNSFPKQQLASDCFRPLSGIQFSLLIVVFLDHILCYLFPSPLGDSILITLVRVGKLILKVSVPSRGFNSHYIRRPLKRRRPALFPSPLGDSILITLWRRHCPATRRRSFRPLSGIQFSLRSHKYVMDDPVDGGGFRPLSGIQFSLQITATRKTWDLSQFPSPLGDSILITSKMSKLRPAG